LNQFELDTRSENQVQPQNHWPSEHSPGSAPAADASRMIELEAENRRLLILVAELLIKNQQLRKANCS